MQGKAKLLSTVTFISSFIAVALVLSYILGFGTGLELVMVTYHIVYICMISNHTCRSIIYCYNRNAHRNRAV